MRRPAWVLRGCQLSMSNGIICTAVAALYDKPEDHQIIIDEGLYGREAEILEKGEKFWKIRMEYNYEGYVHENEIIEGEWPEGKKLRVLKNQIAIMDKPDVTSVMLQTVTRGGVIVKAPSCEADAELKPGWIRVLLADGTEGFTKESFVADYIPLSFEKPMPAEGQDPAEWEAELRERLVEAALGYQGTTYRWGGKSPQGIDCSGLCSMAYLLNGIKIYRDAAIKPGFPVKAIPVENMKRGDLVMFKGHVAMYLGGERKLFLHSTARSGSDGVDINSFLPGDPIYRQDLHEGILEVASLF